MSHAPPKRLILASTSPYRRELLARLGLAFTVAAPGVDESPEPGETPAALAVRLATAKALAVARSVPDAVVIGSDQVAELDGRTLGKPGDRERTIAQLAASSGREVVFHTGVAVASHGSDPHVELDRTRVVFRALASEDIERYVDRERPFACAGGFKAEALGIALFERIESSDPTALIGLPLIALARLLRAAGFTLP